MGLDEATKKALASEFMPLASDCIEMARERDPGMRGMLAVEIGAAGDPDLGAVVDIVRFPDTHTLSGLELMDCVKQSALSMSLPPPERGGREDLMITIPVGEAEP